jgi:hypothetical protein
VGIADPDTVLAHEIGMEVHDLDVVDGGAQEKDRVVVLGVDLSSQPVVPVLKGFNIPTPSSLSA